MLEVGGMFVVLALVLAAVYAIAAAAEAISPGVVGRVERKLGFAPESRGWEVPTWRL